MTNILTTLVLGHINQLYYKSCKRRSIFIRYWKLPVWTRLFIRTNWMLAYCAPAIRLILLLSTILKILKCYKHINGELVAEEGRSLITTAESVLSTTSPSSTSITDYALQWDGKKNPVIELKRWTDNWSLINCLSSQELLKEKIEADTERDHS